MLDEAGGLTTGRNVEVRGNVKNVFKKSGMNKSGQETKILKSGTCWVKGWVPYK